MERSWGSCAAGRGDLGQHEWAWAAHGRRLGTRPQALEPESGPQAGNTPSFLSSTLNLHDKQQRNKKCYKLKPRFPRRSSFKQPFAVFWVPAATAVVIRRRWTLTSWHHLADVLNCEDRQLLPGVDPDHAVAEAGHRQHGSSRRRASQLGRPGEQRRAG